MTIKFIDLFAGMGGFRLGFEQACTELGLKYKCVFTSEIKKPAVAIYKLNFPKSHITGDITKVDPKSVPDFDYLLGGFPCQAFSVAGKQRGFADTRGTLFFNLANILKEKKPRGFILENVTGLITHGSKVSGSKLGSTMVTILGVLRELGYTVTYRTFNSAEFGVPQARKRIFIVGHLDSKLDLRNHYIPKKILETLLETGKPCVKSEFTERLLKYIPKDRLRGGIIRDTRNGPRMLHSWDFRMSGSLSKLQLQLMESICNYSRLDKWNKSKGIPKCENACLTTDEIHTFFTNVSKLELQSMLDDITDKGYLRLEYPRIYSPSKGTTSATHLSKGYFLYRGALSFTFNRILDPKALSGTLVATEVPHLGVLDIDGIRRLTSRECLRLSGFPETYQSGVESHIVSINQLYDLIGNTLIPQVAKFCAMQLLSVDYENSTGVNTFRGGLFCKRPTHKQR